MDRDVRRYLLGVSAMIVLLLFAGAAGDNSLAQTEGEMVAPVPAAGQSELPEEVQVVFMVVDPEAIPRGTCATLVWEADPGWPVSLDGEKVSPNGNRRICLQETATYSLRVDALGGPYEKKLTLRVGDQRAAEQPQPSESEEVTLKFDAVPALIEPGRVRQVAVAGVWVWGVAGAGGRGAGLLSQW